MAAVKVAIFRFFLHQRKIHVDLGGGEARNRKGLAVVEKYR